MSYEYGNICSQGAGVCEAGDRTTIPTGESEQIQVCVLIIIIIADTPNSRRDSRSVELWNSCFPKVIYLTHATHGPRAQLPGQQNLIC